jgi:hypothetical protein
MTGTNGGGTNGNGSAPRVGTDTVKMGLAQMLKGGVIVSVDTFQKRTRSSSRVGRTNPTKEDGIKQ